MTIDRTVTPTSFSSVTATTTTTTTITTTNTVTSTQTDTVTTTTTSVSTTTVYVKPTGPLCSADSDGDTGLNGCNNNCACGSRVGGYAECWSSGNCIQCNSDADCGAGSFCSNSQPNVHFCGFTNVCLTSYGCSSTYTPPNKRDSLVAELFGFDLKNRAGRIPQRTYPSKRTEWSPIVGRKIRVNA